MNFINSILKILKKTTGFLLSAQHPYIRISVILVFILIIINVAYYFVSAYSPGCVVCHYMKPYYEQSSHSVHKEISCVTCHPSRRILTAPYLLRYIAGSYNPRPRAEVEDKVCLDCHEEQNLKKQTAFEMNISFDHSDHLGDLKRGKKLRCTSCHARGESEEHFVINKNVCFTCHFKGSERGHSSTGCNVCHGIPKQVVEHGGFKFNHESYLKIGVDCSQCHLDVTKGNAEVDKKKCYQCHIERTEEFSNIDKIHNVHINERGVDCEECHNAIEHGRVRMISTLEANCENCHQLRHTPQREMYIGSEGRGVGSIPSRMFAAQVSCEGCHLDLNNDGKSDLSERRQTCVKCHEPGFDLMLDRWIADMDDAVKSVEPSIEHIRQLINSAKSNGRNVDAEMSFFTDIETNFNLVKDGKGVHNIDYALRLLENISNNIEGIAGSLGNKNYKVTKGKLLTDESEYCNLCHFAIKPKDVSTFGGDKFPHQTHVKFLKCTKCHSKTEHKKITVTKDDCQSCHKNFSKIPDNIKYKS
ncbi:MAG TPA: cytochrome c3 family protein, partial [Ignavibacteria bacterium]|nr:cytochrome c3 family protein [Ignavibacteria bacterium]